MSKRTAQDITEKGLARQAHALMTKYDRLYQEAHGHRKVFNRYSAKWGMIDVIESVGYERAGQLLDFYFSTKNDHSIEYFYKIFDRLDANERAIMLDREHRAAMRRATEQMVREDEDQQRSGSNLSSM